VAYLRFDERGGWPPEGPPAPLGAPPPPSPPPRCPAPPKLVERPGLLACPSPLSPRWDINPLSFRSPPPPRLLPLIQPNRKSPGNPPTHETDRRKRKNGNRPEQRAARRGGPATEARGVPGGLGGRRRLGFAVVSSGEDEGGGRAVRWVWVGKGRGEVGAKRKGEATRWELVLGQRAWAIRVTNRNYFILLITNPQQTDLVFNFNPPRLGLGLGLGLGERSDSIGWLAFVPPAARAQC
jgi:hypothetical protein